MKACGHDGGKRTVWCVFTPRSPRKHDHITTWNWLWIEFSHCLVKSWIRWTVSLKPLYTRQQFDDSAVMKNRKVHYTISKFLLSTECARNRSSRLRGVLVFLSGIFLPAIRAKTITRTTVFDRILSSLTSFDAEYGQEESCGDYRSAHHDENGLLIYRRWIVELSWKAAPFKF